MLGDLAAVKATDVDDFDVNRVAGWWHSHEAPAMRPASVQAPPNFVAYHSYVLDCACQIGQGAMQIGDEPFHAFCSRRVDPRLMLNEVWTEQVVQDGNVAPRETNLDELVVRFLHVLVIVLTLGYADSWGYHAVPPILMQCLCIQYSDVTLN